MNENNPIPPRIAEQQPTIDRHVSAAATEADRVPIQGVVPAIEAVLRQPNRILYHLTQPGAGKVTTALLIIFFFASLIYGVVVGTFSGHQQLWAAPVKITLGLFVSAAICLPSLYIFSCLNGSQARLSEVAGLVAGLLALITILLIGFAPVAWVFSQSTDSIVAMGCLHLAFLGIATYFGLRFMNSGFRRFSVGVGEGTKLWVIIFILVVLQMSTALRPIIGIEPTFLPSEKKFFLSHWSDQLTSQKNAPLRNLDAQ